MSIGLSVFSVVVKLRGAVCFYEVQIVSVGVKFCDSCCYGIKNWKIIRAPHHLMGFDEAILYIQYPGEGYIQFGDRNISQSSILLHKFVSFTVLRGGQATGDDAHTS